MKKLVITHAIYTTQEQVSLSWQVLLTFLKTVSSLSNMNVITLNLSLVQVDGYHAIQPK